MASSRAEAVKARTDTRAWIMDRRARTRRLIELGGLVEKSGLYATLGDDDPDAVLLGALLMLKARIEETADAGEETDPPSPAERLLRWRRRGRRALRGTDGA